MDAHCHAYIVRERGVAHAVMGPYPARARAAGITCSVVFPYFDADYRTANLAVARLVRRNSDRFIGFAFVDAVRDRGRVGAMLEEAICGFGFRGIKAHRHDAAISREICAVARALSVPVLYDVMGDVRSVPNFAKQFPDVDFIVPHLSSFQEDARAQIAFLDVLAGEPNVHTDTSGVRWFDLLQRAVERAGAAKVLFGTDGPWLHPAVELAKARALGIAPGDMALVLGGNLLRLIRRHGPVAAADPCAAFCDGNTTPPA